MAHSKDLDAAAKVILQTEPRALARLTLGGRALRSVQAVDTDLPTLSRRADKIFRLTIHGVRGPVWQHLEVQARWKSDVPWRVLEYRTHARRLFPRVESCVLVLQPDSRRGRPRGRYTESSVFGKPLIDFRFDVVCAWDLGVERLLGSGEPGLLPLVPFARGADVDHVARAAAALHRLPRERSRSNLLGALGVFAGKVFRGADWSAIIPERYLVQNSFLDPLLLKAKREAKRQMVTDQVRIRLGRRALPFVRRLEGCDDAEIVKRAAEAIGRTSTVDALIAALDQLLPPTTAKRRTRVRSKP